MNNPEVVVLDFRALLEAAPDGIAVVDAEGRMLVVNEQLANLFGYEMSELVGTRVATLVPPHLRDVHRSHRARYVANPTRRSMGLGMDLVGIRKDGQEIPLEISLSPVQSGGRAFTIAVVRDISDRRQLQAEREALRTIVDTERERYRIGMDLHDGVMQDIYAVTLGLELVYTDVADAPERAQSGISRSIDQLHKVIGDLRSFIFDLRPREFSGDIYQALQELGHEFQENASIATNVTLSSELPEIDHNLALALYLITHEALSNIRKHAKASLVCIDLRAVDQKLELEIKDDGVGFDAASEPPEGHRGLRNIRSRGSAVGAEVRIESTPGNGTSITVGIPHLGRSGRPST